MKIKGSKLIQGYIMFSLQNKKVLLAVVVAVLVVLGGVTYWFFGRRSTLQVQPPVEQAPEVYVQPETSPETTP